MSDQDAPELLAIRQYDQRIICDAVAAIYAYADAEIKLVAIEALPYIVPPNEIYELLLPCLFDDRSSVRWTAGRLFRKYPDQRLIPDLSRSCT
jgi:hypothetical protein